MIISDEAFEYLKWQAGDIYDLHTDRAAWAEAYERKLLDQLDSIAPSLRSVRPCKRILDVGSGLGGINAWISRFYDLQPEVMLLDGDNGIAKTERNGIPHNSMTVARKFLADNGVMKVRTMTPEILKPSNVDLVISFAAWCFHIPPVTYLDFVAKCCKKSTVIILDVRKVRADWLAQLRERFEDLGEICAVGKASRRRFRLAA